MTREEIRELLGRDPFRPFRLHLTNGGAFDVLNPGLAVAMQSELFLALPDGDRWVFIPYLHVSAVEGLGNGQARNLPPA
jgi:hypothetical protein